jgi:hypothetical protein
MLSQESKCFTFLDLRYAQSGKQVTCFLEREVDSVRMAALQMRSSR